MNGFPDVDQLRTQMDAPHPSDRMSSAALGESLAQLVWESFTDFIADVEHRPRLAQIGVPLDGGLPGERVAEELLILHMWAHSRAVQLSFYGRVPDVDVRKTLDHMHRAVFEDMVENGTPSPQIPVFEQRVSARYAEFYAAAQQSDAQVGEVAAEHLVDAGAESSTTAPSVLTERAVEIANPLRDFLAGTELESRDPGMSESED